MQRKLYIDIFQIVFAGSFHVYIAIPWASVGRQFDFLFTGQVAYRIAFTLLGQVIDITLEDNFTPKRPAFGPMSMI